MLEIHTLHNPLNPVLFTQMAVALSPETLDEIYSRLKRIFSDVYDFETLIAPKLYEAIRDSNQTSINPKTMKRVVERYFDKEHFKPPEQKSKWLDIQIIFKTCYVLIISYHEYPMSLIWDDLNFFKQSYQEFYEHNDIDEDEWNLLLNFRNYLRVTLLLIPARLNKQSILKIAARLEGSNNEYITGGGQRNAVTRRVRIYEKEGGVTQTKAPYHSNNRAQPSSSRVDPKLSVDDLNHLFSFGNNNSSDLAFDELMATDIYDGTFSEEIDLSMMASLL